MLLDSLTSVLKSRKAWHFDLDVLKAIAVKLLAIWAIQAGWAPGKAEALVADGSHLIALAWIAGGALKAVATAFEDFARKWGIRTEPPASAEEAAAEARAFASSSSGSGA